VLIFRKAQFTPPLGHRDPFRCKRTSGSLGSIENL
jgi:hypothetical protein